MLRGVISTIAAVLWATILVLVGGRFFALLVGASRDSELVDRLYRHSDFWVKPFFGMFDLSNKTVSSTGGVFEPASFLALIVYILAGMLVMAILTSAASPLVRGRHTHITDAP